MLRFDVLPLVGSLSTDARGRLTAGTARRAYMRWLILRRYAELRCHPMTNGLSAGRLNRLVVDEAKAQFPDVKVSDRSLYRWIQIWNKVGDNRFAAGPSSLIEFRGRPHTPRRRSRPHEPGPRVRPLKRGSKIA